MPIFALLWKPFVIILAMTAIGVLLYLRVARKLLILDSPNGRSSHNLPTPRGGGIVIALTFLVGLVYAQVTGSLALRDALALGGAGTLAAGVGFIDDLRGLPATLRLFVHFLVAAWLLWWFSPLPIFPTGPVGTSLNALISALLLVWLLNLYNFMDGINGIATLEGISTCLGILLVYAVSGHQLLGTAPILLLASLGGFLFWNFPRAQIFMGDVGSGFLGAVLGGMCLQASHRASSFFWCWAVLLGIFIMDASLTLCRRLLDRKSPTDAHCSHAYQIFSRQRGEHAPVSIAVFVINLLWLLPVALLIATHLLSGPLGLCIAYCPLLLIGLKVGAGVRN